MGLQEHRPSKGKTRAIEVAWSALHERVDLVVLRHRSSITITMTRRRALLIALAVLGLLTVLHAQSSLQSREGYIDVEGGRVWFRIVGSERESRLS